jgi:hypothetical protein
VIHIYTPTIVDGWEWALPKVASDDLEIVELFGKPIADSWVPIRMKRLCQDEFGRSWKDADMPWLGNALLILKPRAVAALGDLCLRAGELLPLICDDAELVAWNVTTVVDALDKNSSKILWHSDGSVMWVEEYVFNADIIDGLIAFRIPEARADIFVESMFVKRVNEAGLTGTHFKEIWSSQ